MAAWCVCACSLSNLSRRFGKGLGDLSGIVIAKLIEFNAVLTSLDISKNNLEAEAGKALAGALSVNAVLTKLNLDGFELNILCSCEAPSRARGLVV